MIVNRFGHSTPNKSICIIYSSNNINYSKLLITNLDQLLAVYKAMPKKNKSYLRKILRNSPTLI